MAEISMNDFLLRYYRQRHFNVMPPEKLAQYEDYLKRDDFNGNMKKWKSDLMYQNSEGKWVANELPDPGSANFFLNDKEWEKLFKAFQNAMREMAANPKALEDNAKAKDFLNEYFGDPVTHLFSNAEASQEAEASIQELKNLLTDTNLRSTVEFLIKEILKEADISYEDLISGITSKKYNTNPKFQSTLKQVAYYMNYYVSNNDVLSASPYANTKFSAIENGFDSAPPPKDKLDYFKNNYKTLLNTLHDEKKIYDVFKQFDNGKISKHLDEAISKVDYSNKESKDFVPPKRDDELTPLQQIRDHVKDTLEDYMGKYTKLRGDRLYFSESAKLIVKAIDGTKFKPTEGLDKILENVPKIKDNLKYKSFRATEHLTWFSETLTELKNTMPKAFAGALKNGRQMKALVEQIILKAVPDKKEEAKTAMEILSVVRYGYTTSKIMDTLRKEEFTLFSDGNLSWNKNEATKFITTALDKSIKTAFLGIGYGITAAWNAYNLSNMKFKGKTKKIKTHHEQWVNKNNADKAAARQKKDIDNQRDRAEKQNQEGILRNTNITEQTINQEKQNLETLKNDASQKYSKFNNSSNIYNEAKALIDQNQNYTDEINQLNNDIRNLNTEISDIDNKLNNAATFAGMPQPAANALANDLVRQKNEKQALIQENTTRIQELRNQQQQISQQELLKAQNNIAQYQQNFSDAQREYDDAQRLADDLDSRINLFETASSRIEELSKHIQQREDKINKWDENHKDVYKELMAHWDYLETGRTSHTGKMYSWRLGSAKLKQKNFDKIKQAQLDAYISRYQMAP